MKFTQDLAIKLTIVATAVLLTACGKPVSSQNSVAEVPKTPSTPSTPSTPLTPSSPSAPAAPSTPSAPTASSPSTPTAPGLDPAPLLDGLYKVQVTYVTSFKLVYMKEFSITGGSVEADYGIGLGSGASKLHQKGTYGYRDGELIFVQESLELTLAAGDSVAFNCPAISGQPEGVPIDVAGKTCRSTQFWNNLSLVATGYFMVNNATFTSCVKSGLRFGNDCGLFDFNFSFILQRQLPELLPTAAPADGVYSGGFNGMTMELNNSAVDGSGYYGRVQSITLAGQNLTVVSNVIYVSNAATITPIGSLTTSGTYVLDAPSGHIRFLQSSMIFSPNSAASANLICAGVMFTTGMNVDVAGKTCSYVDFRANGEMYSTGLTGIDADTIMPCPEGFFNCQKDVFNSFVRH